MRKMHGSMMDPAVPRGGSGASVGTDGKQLASPVARAESLGWLLQHVMRSQSAQAIETAAALPGFAFNFTAMREAWAMGEAALDQWRLLNHQWLEGLDELRAEMGEIRQANTVSKYVDQEMNLVQQGLALLTNQATAGARLAENIQVNAIWLLRQQTTGRRG